MYFKCERHASAKVKLIQSHLISNHDIHLTHCGLLMTYGFVEPVSIGLGNDLFTNVTKPLLEPMMISHQWGQREN